MDLNLITFKIRNGTAGYYNAPKMSEVPADSQARRDLWTYLRRPIFGRIAFPRTVCEMNWTGEWNSNTSATKR